MSNHYCTWCLHWIAESKGLGLIGVTAPKTLKHELKQHLKKMKKIGSKQIHYGRKLVKYDKSKSY
jgi:hypothetical protein